MNSADARILAVNAGSSSIKFALFATAPTLRRTLAGRLQGVGQKVATFTMEGEHPGDGESRIVSAPDHAAAVGLLMDWFVAHRERLSITAVGHRLVHGGPRFSAPLVITAGVLQELQEITAFAPTHLPEQIQLARAFQQRFPGLPQVACFDTAFHQSLPRVARMLPIPRRFESRGVHRYGFHGLSYTFLMGELTRLDGEQKADGRVILAHLGSGASLAAVHGGKPIDTSMGFTPTGGFPMGTRSGDLDPGLLSFLARDQHLSPAQLDAMMTLESGLLGMSETSSDVRELLDREGRDHRAAEALAVFCYQIKKWIGAFAAAMGGLDTLVFSGGIGEHAPEVRRRICDGLAFLGIEIDQARNAANAPMISTPAGATLVRVIKTDEEVTIAALTCELLGVGPKTGKKQ